MSYINDALLKAQKEKKSPYAVYEPVLSASGKKTGKPRRKFLITGILIFFLCATGFFALMHYSSGVKKAPVQKPLMVAQAQNITPAIKPVVVPQPVIRKAAAVNKNETALKTKTVPAKTQTEPKVRQGVADAKTLYAQAVKKQQEGKLEEAKRLYKKVIKIDPRNVQALNNLGVIYMNKKTYKWAVVRLNDAIKVKHDYPDAHYNLACLYAQQNDTNRSLSYLKNAVGLNPQVKKWAENDNDLKVLADLPEFKKLLEKN
jgi:tetratricopeptide (TPR) repeat protein